MWCPPSRRCVTRFDLPISVDTWRSSVLDAALSAGRLRRQRHQRLRRSRLPRRWRPGTARRSSPRTSASRPGSPDPAPDYPEGVVEAVVRVLRRPGRARPSAAGIPRERIMVDAGLDLGKTEPMSLELLRASRRLAALGYPVFLSASNKRFLGEILGLVVDDRRLASVAAHAPGDRPRLPGAPGARRAWEPEGRRLHGRRAGGARHAARDARRRRLKHGRAAPRPRHATSRWSAKRWWSWSAGWSGEADRSLMVADLTIDGEDVTVGRLVGRGADPAVPDRQAGGVGRGADLLDADGARHAQALPRAIPSTAPISCSSTRGSRRKALLDVIKAAGGIAHGRRRGQQPAGSDRLRRGAGRGERAAPHDRRWRLLVDQLGEDVNRLAGLLETLDGDLRRGPGIRLDVDDLMPFLGDGAASRRGTSPTPSTGVIAPAALGALTRMTRRRRPPPARR